MNWNTTYNPKHTQPYGTSVLRTLLGNIRQNQEFIFINDSTYKELPINPTPSVDNYIYVGSDFYGEPQDNDTLIKFMEAGNIVFISSNELNQDLLQKVILKTHKNEESQVSPPIEEELSADETIPAYEEEYPYEEDETPIDDEEGNYSEEDYYDDEELFEYEEIAYTLGTETTMQDSIFLQTREEKYDRARLSFVFEFDTVPHDWNYFSELSEDLTKDGTYRNEGFFTKTRNPSSIRQTNFISIAVGQGRLYLHLTPLALTNYSLLNKDHMLYARELFQHLGKGKVYWGEDNRTYAPNRDPNQPNSSTPSEGPMEFILSEPSLRSAWYTLLFGSILYMIFGVKRKQRVIPIAESMQNTSIEYAEVISQLFMEQEDHKKLVDLKMEIFKSNLREKYNIKLPATLDEENDEFFKLVSIKTGASQELIKEIFLRYKAFIKNIIVETPEMLAFNQRIEEFYKTSR